MKFEIRPCVDEDEELIDEKFEKICPSFEWIAHKAKACPSALDLRVGRHAYVFLVGDTISRSEINEQFFMLY